MKIDLNQEIQLNGYPGYNIRKDKPCGWSPILYKVMPGFPEVAEIRFGELFYPYSPSGAENQILTTTPEKLPMENQPRSYIMGIFIETYTPGFRLRELKLILKRFFSHRNSFPVQFACAIDRSETPGVRAAHIYPMSGLLTQVKCNGSLLYRRCPDRVESSAKQRWKGFQSRRAA